MPLYFIANQGQLDERVDYYIQGRDKTVYFTSEGLTFALTGPEGRQSSTDMLRPMAASVLGSSGTERDATSVPQRWALKVDFVGANPDVQPQGQDRTPAAISYFKGPQAKWRTGLPTYASVLYRDLWPGIDLIYTGTVNQMKYTFLLQPGADPGRIRLAYHGATSVRLDEAGQLEVSTPAGGFHDQAPVAYQDVDGHQVEVRAAYDLQADTAGSYIYGFRLGDYDRGRPLVLDRRSWFTPATSVAAVWIVVAISPWTRRETLTSRATRPPRRRTSR